MLQWIAFQMHVFLKGILYKGEFVSKYF
jgi:hypothetical protein